MRRSAARFVFLASKRTQLKKINKLLHEVTTPVAAALEGLANNVVATSEVALDGVRGNIRSMETNLGNLIADAYLWQAEQLAEEFGVDVPQFALANGGGIRNDNVIPAGDITELTTFDILPFLNFLTVVPDVPVDVFETILENAVSAIGGTSGTGRYAQVGGITIRYDAAATPQAITCEEDGSNCQVTTPGERIISAVLNDGTVVIADGEIVDESLTIDMVSVDFLIQTNGDDYPFNGIEFISLGVTYQQTLLNYITEGLGGQITAAQYPEGGEGRVLTLEQSVSVEDPIDALPQEYALNGNYPNPFNPTTTISFSLPEAAQVSIAVYDMLGRQVMELVNTQMTAGNHEVVFSADNLPSGTYFYRLTTPQGAFVKQMVLLK